MRKIKEVLRLRFELRLRQREIARACSISQGACPSRKRRGGSIILVHAARAMETFVGSDCVSSEANLEVPETEEQAESSNEKVKARSLTSVWPVKREQWLSFPYADFNEAARRRTLRVRVRRTMSM
jgi:hypothetical protein